MSVVYMPDRDPTALIVERVAYLHLSSKPVLENEILREMDEKKITDATATEIMFWAATLTQNTRAILPNHPDDAQVRSALRYMLAETFPTLSQIRADFIDWAAKQDANALRRPAARVVTEQTIFRLCPVCKARVARMALSCPSCGHPILAATAVKAVSSVPSRVTHWAIRLYRTNRIVHKGIVATFAILIASVVLFPLLAVFGQVPFSFEGLFGTLGFVVGMLLIGAFFSLVGHLKTPGPWRMATRYPLFYGGTPNLALVELMTRVMYHGMDVSEEDIRRAGRGLPAPSINPRELRMIAVEIAEEAKTTVPHDASLLAQYERLAMLVAGRKEFVPD